MRKLKHVNEKPDSNYLDLAREWMINTKAPFSSARAVAVYAIAEYLANQDGYTLYDSVLEVEEDEVES